jgi:hypothetical protein
VTRNVVSEHKAVVRVEVDDRLVCVDVVDGDRDDVHLQKNANPASIAVVRH